MRSYFILIFASFALGLYGFLSPEYRPAFDLTMKLLAAASRPADSQTIRQLIKLDGSGRIFTAEYEDPKPGEVWHPTIDLKETVRALKLYVPGRKSAEIVATLGRPKFKETRIPIAVCPEAAKSAQDIWLYNVGPSGWGCTVALCFTDKLCTQATVLSFAQEFAYEAWKTKTISTYAPNRTIADIRQRFGEPERIDKPGANERWSYDILGEAGVWLDINHSGICTGAENYEVFH